MAKSSYNFCCIDCRVSMLLGNCLPSAVYLPGNSRAWGHSQLGKTPPNGGNAEASWVADKDGSRVLSHFLALHRGHKMRCLPDDVLFTHDDYPGRRVYALDPDDPENTQYENSTHSFFLAPAKPPVVTEELQAIPSAITGWLSKRSLLPQDDKDVEYVLGCIEDKMLIRLGPLEPQKFARTIPARLGFREMGRNLTETDENKNCAEGRFGIWLPSDEKLAEISYFLVLTRLRALAVFPLPQVCFSNSDFPWRWVASELMQKTSLPSSAISRGAFFSLPTPEVDSAAESLSLPDQLKQEILDFRTDNRANLW